MRKIYFVVPGTSKEFGCGGLWAALNAFEIASTVCDTELVTSRVREKDRPYLDDVTRIKSRKDSIFIITWGWEIPELLARLSCQNVVYLAQSTGYKFNLPVVVPVITGSRHTLGYWGEKAANNLMFYLPNRIPDEYRNSHVIRDIDVFLQLRKSSHYLLNHLVPALKKKFCVHVQSEYVEDLAGLLNRSKVYLYDSAEYWSQRDVTEGFGLPPLEAMACGCSVFSSVNNGLADYVDPAFNCSKIRVHSLSYDVRRIGDAVENWCDNRNEEALIAEYRTPNIRTRMVRIFHELNDFFDHISLRKPDIEYLRVGDMEKAGIVGRLNRKMRMGFSRIFGRA